MINWDLEIPESITMDRNIIRGGVYFWIRNGVVLYVGTAICIVARLRDHHVITEENWREGDEVRLLYIDDNTKRLQAEKYFIGKYCPPYNGETRVRASQENRARTMAAVEARYPPSEFISIAQAASISGLPSAYVVSLVRTGKVPSVTVEEADCRMRRLIPKAKFVFLHESNKINRTKVGLSRKLLDIGFDLALIESALVAVNSHPHSEAA